VKLIVEDEHVARRSGLRVRRRLEHLDGMNVEEMAEDLVHRQKCGRHPARSGEELAPVDRELLARAFGEFLNSMLHPLLLFRLRRGHVFPVRHHAGRHRRGKQEALVGARALRHLVVVQQTVVRLPNLAGFVPFFDGHDGVLSVAFPLHGSVHQT
jgi:hypothetical protein